MVSDEVIVAITLGLFSHVTLLALWVALPTLKNPRVVPEHTQPRVLERTPSRPGSNHWPSDRLVVDALIGPPPAPGVDDQLSTSFGHVRQCL